MNETSLSLFGAFLTVCCVLVLAYWCSRFLGKSWIKSSSGRHLKVIEQLSVGPDKQLMLVKLQEHVYLLGSSPAGIQLLAEVDGEFEDIGPADNQLQDSGFQEVIKKYASLNHKKRGGD